ncbi:MAG TPA: HEAT repeat domain-containing protein [Actinomycetota bacterium]
MIRLRAALRVRPGEGGLVLRFLAVMLVGLFGATLGGAAVESLFFSRFGPHFLPYLYMALGVATFFVMAAMSAVLARPHPGRVLATLPLGLAVLLLAARTTLLLDQRWLYPVLWVVMMIAWTTQVMVSWGLAGDVHDTRQAKRLFPLYGVGLILGGIAGGLVTGPLAALLGTENLLLIWAAALITVFALGRAVVGPGVRRRRRGRRASVLAEAGEALRQVRAAPLLRWLSLALMLFALLYFTLSLQFAEAATARFPRTEELAGFLGGFMAVSNAAALLLSLLVANRLFARFGVPAMVLALAAIYAVGFGVLVAASGFAILVGFRFVQMVWVNGVWGTGWQALYNVIPSETRARIRSFMDAGPLQAGVVLSGAMLVLADRVLSGRALAALGVAAAGLTAWAMWRARRAYGEALEVALRAGNPDVFGSEDEPFTGRAWDAEAVQAALGGASTRDPVVRRISMEVLSRLDAPPALPALLDALSDPDAEVRAAAARGVGRAGGPSHAAAIEALLDDPDAGVRGSAVQAMRALGGGAASTSLRPLLTDPDPEIAARAAATLVASGDEQALDLLVEMAVAVEPDRRRAAVTALAETGADPDIVLERMSDPDVSVRRAAVAAAGSLEAGGAARAVLQALQDPHPSVREAAVEALRDIRHADPDLLRAYVERETGEALRYDGLWRALGNDGDPRMGLLASAVREESLTHARNALRAAALTGDPSAVELAAANLESRDAQQRANALEMLEAVGPRALVRPIVALWEGAPEPRGDRARALLRLLDDADPWLRSCAAFAAATTEGGKQMETLATLSAMDRVLFLRNVPLFADLTPRDLGRIAGVATEHVFQDGELIAEQGEPGDEMHVVVSGEIRAIVEDDAGGRQEVGRRGPGDYVGEMAIISDQPRMASLVCVGDVRTLALDRKRFERILTDRPEASLAVMRVLCDRLREAHGQLPSSA